MNITERIAQDDLALDAQIQKYLPEEFKTGIERDYYGRVNAQARFSALAHHPDFLQSPMTHVALYSDHGVVHVRDVARQILRVLSVACGVLLPPRGAYRLELMRGYGVMTAYLHDIGMRDFTRFGRDMHAEFATQEVFSPPFDNWIETLWDENWGNLAWHLRNLAEQGALTQEPKMVLREMLSMANCHSKSKVPVDALNNAQTLREVMQETLGTNLRFLHLRQQKDKAWKEMLRVTQAQQDQVIVNKKADRLRIAETALEDYAQAHGPEAKVNSLARRYYQDFDHEAYQWLVSDNPALVVLVGDVVDTLRALRCADALRQRGTVLKTAGGYQVFVDRQSANAIYAVQDDDGRTYLLEVDSILGAGEANLASSELTHEGDMRVSFHRGAFADQDTVERAAFHAAVVVNDVQGDIVESFRRPPADSEAPPKSAAEIRICLESVDDNLSFSDLVCRQLVRVNSALANRAVTVPSLRTMSEHERSRYLHAPDVIWNAAERQEILDNMRQVGFKTEGLDAEDAFADVKRIEMKAGEVLIEAGEPAGFVYVPMTAGLRGQPLGGYAPFTVHAWVPLGTAIIRGALRNATIVSESALTVLAIPKEVYLRCWHHTYSLKEFTEMLSRQAASRPAPPS